VGIVEARARIIAVLNLDLEVGHVRGVAGNAEDAFPGG
jgi:hypothetical protein